MARPSPGSHDNPKLNLFLWTGKSARANSHDWNACPIDLSGTVRCSLDRSSVHRSDPGNPRIAQSCPRGSLENAVGSGRKARGRLGSPLADRDHLAGEGTIDA